MKNEYEDIIKEYDEKCMIYDSLGKEDAEEFIRLTTRQAD